MRKRRRQAADGGAEGEGEDGEEEAGEAPGSAKRDENAAAGASAGEPAEKRGRAAKNATPAAKGLQRAGALSAGGGARACYRLDGGLRHVEPYDFDFTTHVKKRWVGRMLLEVFSREFVAYPEEYYKDAIEAGRVTVGGCHVTPGHILREGERIVHRAVCCRENPVLDCGPVPVVAETEELLVVSKPSSVPIHPCGSYRFNSLISILREQGTVADETALFTTHRLDRLTSGLVLLGKTKSAARQISAWFASNEIRKVYLARVRGNFGEFLARAAGDPSVLPEGCKLLPGGRVRVEGFIRCIDHKVGKYRFSVEWPGDAGEPKDAATEFEFVGLSPSGESVVRCFPATGRTHQIRVHLLHIGHPIANDICYGGDLRSDPALPLIPHVHQATGVDCKGSQQDPVHESETVMHPSGIFLHALTYALPGDLAYTAGSPPWADACTD